MRRLTSWAVLAAGLVTAAGCGESGPKLVPVEGRVTLDGKPVSEMLINFHPLGNTYGTGANAMTDADGRFTLMDSRGGTGAYVGEYADKSPLRVTIPEGGGTADVVLTVSGKDAAVKFQPKGK
jgi:predicted small lipoprotein YifL